MAQYDAAKKTAAPVKQGVLGRPTLSNSWSWLCLRYFADCTEYKLLDARTRHVRRHILEATFDEPIRPGSDKRYADMPLSRMEGSAIEVLRDRKLSTPAAANDRVKAIRQEFKWGVTKGHASSNPAREVSYFKASSEGFHTWTLEEVQHFEERHPIGSKARLALALLLYTGQRRADVVRLGKQHAKRGVLTFTQYKGRNRKPHTLTLPIVPGLQKIIDASPCDDLTFLVNEFGRPFTDAVSATSFGFGAIKPVCRSVRHTGCAKQARPSPQTMARPRVS